jgi:tRNA threonylcarbamoyladenosine biosynthesis protein TsaB
VITLAIDTSEARGSVAVRRDGATVARKMHVDGTDYSAWLLPEVERAVTEADVKMEQVQLLAVSTGPGSFTGLRVGLTAVKAWAEVYGKPIVGISRLKAMALPLKSDGLVATSYDAQRGQVFGGLYRNALARLERVGEELVVAPAEFVAFVGGQAGTERVRWISLDPEGFGELETFRRRLAAGDSIFVSTSELATSIGVLAEESAANGEFSDPVTLDANYVRRSDAEIFWKGSSASVR